MKSDSSHRFAGIIPARYASTRFPGKPLADIGGKTMIRRVYEQASLSLETVYVATDDDRIFKAVRDFGGNVIMTSEAHRSGTDRCAEAISLIFGKEGMEFDIVINVQGDEPFILPEQIDLIKSCFDDSSVEIATLVRRAGPGEDIFNPDQPKVVLDSSGNAIYFSRAAIPFIRDSQMAEWTLRHTYYKHIGLYAYKTATLLEITKLPPGELEIAESLEQNRWLENGYRIRTAVTTLESICIDTPSDLEKAKTHITDFDKFCYL
ncbi:MAG TPA: 3-deoxy-manno-octulosonate cytidylyltransferase [Bacteroidales bacterium]|jgi:3-deoxy-manno-octulosonate cytidylyltransferase (CMP-KDO synthetase)|nr:3-deoxy-manno-octulosonate cytidylyltransferase [Bacteroidales bacterium]